MYLCPFYNPTFMLTSTITNLFNKEALIMTLQEYLNLPEKPPADGAHEKVPFKKRYAAMNRYIRTKIYRHDNTIVFVMKIPSMTNTKVLYDVVTQIDIGNEKNGKFNDYQFTCFSNCPSFTFTYANLFKRKKMICPWLLGKFDTEVKKEKAEKRNPDDNLYLEHSLFLAITHILTKYNSIWRASILSSRISNIKGIALTVKSQKTIEELSKKARKHQLTEKPKEDIIRVKDKKKSMFGSTKVTKVKQSETVSHTKRVRKI